MPRAAIALTLVMAALSCSADPDPGILVATIATSRGSFDVQLYPDSAPRAVANFRTLAGRGYYDGSIFHRVLPGFVIQGGDPTGTGTGGASIWGPRFPDEFDPDVRFDRPGRFAMANSGPGTNGSQFFITVAATPWLNDRHTILGQVIEGLATVDAISEAEVDGRDRPLTDIVVTGIEITVRRPESFVPAKAPAATAPR